MGFSENHNFSILPHYHHGNNISIVTNVYSWLGQIGMAAYASLLEKNGYDSLCYCGGGILDDESLSDIGITSVDDRRYGVPL